MTADVGMYVTYKQVEKILGRDERTIRRYVRDGLIRVYRIPTKPGVLFRRDEIEALPRAEPMAPGAPAA